MLIAWGSKGESDPILNPIDGQSSTYFLLEASAYIMAVNCDQGKDNK